MPPIVVAPVPAFGRGRRRRGIAAKPALGLVSVVLLAPKQAGDRLAEDSPLVVAEVGRRDGLEKVVGLATAPLEDPLVVGEGVRPGAAGVPQPDGLAFAGLKPERNARPDLGSGRRRAYRVAAAVNDRLVKRILYVRRGVAYAPESLRVRLVLSKEQLVRALDVQPETPQVLLRGLHHRHVSERLEREHIRARGLKRPAPRVSEPQLRQEHERGGTPAGIGRGDPNEHVVRIFFGVLDDDVEVAIFVEDAGVE